MNTSVNRDLDLGDLDVRYREPGEASTERMFVVRKREWSGGARQRTAARHRRKGGSLVRIGGLAARRNKRVAF